MKTTLTANDDHSYSLTAGVGMTRLLLDQAKQNAQSFVMAPNLSNELKIRWQRRVSEFGRLLALLPPPVDPREPYSDDVDLAHVEIDHVADVGVSSVEMVAPVVTPEAPDDDLSDLLG